ncbi:hypothetical protein U1769_09470 [Sphingomonas sp. ZT3P38]|uniref:hypothetical protein n=1 Tax=Parasphingomonas zepuensis TaxID=3096161 RepID=UPI002FCC0ABE
MGTQNPASTAQHGNQPAQAEDPDRQDRDGQQKVINQQNQQDQAAKTRTQADLAGGGSNNGSNLGSNEDIDQAGGRGGGTDGDR